MSKRHWRIRGYNSANLIFDRKVPFDHLSESDVRKLLKRLASIHLTPDEVLASSLGHRAPERAAHLEIQLATVPGSPFGLMTGGNPYYTAGIEEAEPKTEILTGGRRT